MSYKEINMTYSFRPVFAWAAMAASSCAVVALAVSPQMAFYMLFFAVVCWWTWEHEELAFLYFLVLAPLLPMLKFTQTLGTFTLVKDVLILTLFVKVFAWPLLTQRLPYRRNILFLPIIALALWTGLALVQADSLALGVLRGRDIALYTLLYFVALYLPIPKDVLQKRLAWIATSGGILLLAGLYQWFFAPDSAVLRFDPMRNIWIPRMSATFAHPTVFGEYLTMLAAIFGGSVATAKNARVRLWSLVASVVVLPFVYLTFSRGVWLGYVGTVGTLVLMYGWQKWGASISIKKVWFWAAGLLVLCLLVLAVAIRFTPIGIFVRSAFDPTYASNQIRLEFLARLVATTSNWQAMVGHGLGDIAQKAIQNQHSNVTAFDIASGASREVQLSKDSTLVDNQYLKTFIEMGLFGILIYLWIYWRVLAHGWKHANTSIFSYVAAAFVVGFAIQALFVDIWDVFPTNAYVWVVAGLLSGSTSKTA